MMQQFETIQKASKENVDAALKAFGATSKGVQTLAVEATDYAKKSFETGTATLEKLAGVKGVEVVNDAFFNEFTVKLPKPAAGVVEALAQRRILAGVPASRLFPGEHPDLLLVAATETNTDSDMNAFAQALAEVL